MMLSLHNGQDSDLAFSFFLAEKLCITVGQIDDMPRDEYIGWVAYFAAKNAKATERGRSN